MPSPAWTATDGSGNLAHKWREQPSGSALRLTLLRIHMSEVAAAISTGNYVVQGRSRDRSYLNDYLKELVKAETEEASVADVSASVRSAFTRGRAL